MMEDDEFQRQVKKIYDEERGGGMKGYERFKKRCVEKAVEKKKKKKNKRGRDQHKLNIEIQKMRRFIEWTESAKIAQEGTKDQEMEKREENAKRGG